MRRSFLAALVPAAALSVPMRGVRAGHTVVVVGDSLNGGYGLAAEQSGVAMLDDRLGEKGYGDEDVNASTARAPTVAAPGSARRRTAGKDCLASGRYGFVGAH